MSCFYLHDLTLALRLVTTDFFFSQQREKKNQYKLGTNWLDSSSAKTDVNQQGVDKLEKVQ